MVGDCRDGAASSETLDLIHRVAIIKDPYGLRNFMSYRTRSLPMKRRLLTRVRNPAETESGNSHDDQQRTEAETHHGASRSFP